MKKIIILLLAVICIATINSCKKEDPTPDKPDCEVNKYGTITVSNSSSNPYKIFIDSIFIVEISGGSISSKIEIKEGNNRQLNAVQVSGYLFYPTEKIKYLNIISCSDYSWQIP